VKKEVRCLNASAVRGCMHASCRPGPTLLLLLGLPLLLLLLLLLLLCVLLRGLLVLLLVLVLLVMAPSLTHWLTPARRLTD